MEQRFFAQWQKLANPAYCQLYLPDKILNPRFWVYTKQDQIYGMQ